MCIGNRVGGDDAIGPYIANKIKKETKIDMILDCGTTPENYTSIIKQKKPSTLIIIDAAEMEQPAGTIRIIPKEKLGTMHISTHGIPLSILISYLEREVDHIIVIGIQPKQMSGTLSAVVKKSGDQLIELLKKHRYQEIPPL
ncbi:hydrogenase 3 maturation endopeptidase HyCI [Thermoplasmatales archaeon SM1-50]|nr:MAG: hydrogenase 3 maturation endopeptidase HyCI [Thermoplasmatales archaeon SM1-50]